MLSSSSPSNGLLRGPVEISLGGTSSLRTIRVSSCQQPRKDSRLGRSSRHGHGVEDGVKGATDSLGKGERWAYSGYLWPSDTIGFRIGQLWRPTESGLTLNTEYIPRQPVRNNSQDAVNSKPKPGEQSRVGITVLSSSRIPIIPCTSFPCLF